MLLAAAAVVMVQVLPPGYAEEHGERLITACTQGLRQGACVLSNETTVERASTVVAEVRWEDETFRVAVIRLGRPRAGEHEWTSGKVAFDEGDSIPDRWTTAGFTIATLAGDLTSRIGESAAPPIKETARPPALPNPGLETDRGPRVRQPQRAAFARAAAGLAVGQAMHDQPPRLGPWASIAYAPFDLPLALCLRGVVTWAEASGVEARWSTIAVGLEARLPVIQERAALLVAIDGGPSLLTASSDRKQDRVFATAALLVGFDVLLVGPFSLLGGGEVSASPTTALKVTSGAIADRRFKLGGLVGLGAKL